MSELGFALFETAIGHCGIVWSERGVAGVQLPERNEPATRNRILRRFAAAREAVPPDVVQRVIADMRRTPLALVALTDPVSLNPEDQRKIALAMRLGLVRHAPHEPYARGTLLAAELKNNWTAIDIYGGYILFRQTSAKNQSGYK